jgi:ornithine cyclodeaminase/alanine dehydrogenase-like protein (mu-crystallin family)
MSGMSHDAAVATRFLLLSEADVRAVLTMGDLVEAMASALGRFSAGEVVQPVRSVISVGAQQAFFGTMPAYVTGTAPPSVRASGSGGRASLARDSDAAASAGAAMGAKLVTVFGENTARGLPTHLAAIVLLDPETGALLALLDGRYITEARTAAVSAVSSRLLARKNPATLAIIGSGVQARSHLEALTHVHGGSLREVRVWSPTEARRRAFAEETSTASVPIVATDTAEAAITDADIIALVTASTTPVIDNRWVKDGAHVMAVGACRPTHREVDPALMARARVFVDSRAAALVEAGDIVMAMNEGRFGQDHILAEIGALVNGANAGSATASSVTAASPTADSTAGLDTSHSGASSSAAAGRQRDTDVTLFKSLGLAVEDVTAANLAYRRARDRGIGRALTL